MIIPLQPNTVGVEYVTEVCDATGRRLRGRAPKRNLVLNGGLDFLFSYGACQMITHLVASTSTSPVKRDSGVTTVSVSGGVATSSANYFEAADVGRVLKLDAAATEYVITAYTSPTQVSVTGPDHAGGECTVWYVNDVGHVGGAHDVISSLQTNAGDNNSTLAAGVWEHKRTFLGPVRATPVTYRAVGWSPVSNGTQLFGRDVIPGLGDTVNTGERYRVTVRLFVSYSPAAPTAHPNISANGFNSAGTLALETSNYQVTKWNTAGALIASSGVLDPGGPGAGYKLILTVDAWTQPASLVAANRPNVTRTIEMACAKSAYAPGSRYVDFTADVVTPITGARAMLWANNWTDTTGVSLVFTTPQNIAQYWGLLSVLRVSFARSTLVN